MPGRCMACGADVIWTGKSWKKPGKGGARHVCPTDRPVCGAFMRNARERCARRGGHGYEHRTAYAMENARRKGLAA